MTRETLARAARLWVLLALALGIVGLSPAHAQGFISPSLGYNFGGSAGCAAARDCHDKRWNWGGSIGSLGSIFGRELELTYKGRLLGDSATERSSVTTLMGNFMLAPRIAIVQPYGLIGIGLMRTTLEEKFSTASDSQNQIGWTLGGGVMIFVQRHVGLKGDIRYYHSFQALHLLGFDLGNDSNKIDFGRAALGLVLRF